MASRNMWQFQYSLNPMLTYIEGSFKVGASGAVKPSTGQVGSGVSSVAKTATGQYTIQLQDNYNRLLNAAFTLYSPTSSAGTTQDGSLTVGNPYQIVFPSSSTNWTTLGVPTGVTPLQGVPFVATSGASNGPLGSSGVTAAGNGIVIPVIRSGIDSIELLPGQNMNMGPLPQGAYVQFQTFGTSALIPVSPTSGTTISFGLFLRNSSVLGQNELPYPTVGQFK